MIGDGKVIIQDDADALREKYNTDLEAIFREVYRV